MKKLTVLVLFETKSGFIKFLPEIPVELYQTICLIIQENLVGEHTKRFDVEISAIIVKLQVNTEKYFLGLLSYKFLSWQLNLQKKVLLFYVVISVITHNQWVL